MGKKSAAFVTRYVNHQLSGEVNESLISACSDLFGNKAIFMHIN
jgi:hypothetical protein